MCERRLARRGALRLGGCRRECGCARPISSPPLAPHVLFTCLSPWDGGAFIFIACAFKRSQTPLQTHQISRDTHPCTLYRPLSKKVELSRRFRKARKVDFGIRSGTQVPPPFRKTSFFLLRHSFRNTFLTSGASWEPKAERRIGPGWEMRSGL